MLSPNSTDAERERSALFHTYHRLPLNIEKGEDVYLIDRNGRRYLDLFAGLAVNALGYGHPEVVQAIRAQAGRYCHLSNYFLQPQQIGLAERLLAFAGSPYSKVFFSNSGTEAVEGAIKIARRWGTGRKKAGLVSLRNSFHGRTLGALSLMDRPGYQEGFGPFLAGCQVTDADPAALRSIVSDTTAAVFIEVIQGEGGINAISREFASEIGSLRKKYGFLLVADEIQSGLGRTGKPFAFDHYAEEMGKPDIVVVAKALGGGLPLGAIVSSDSIAEILQPGSHGTTFGGNPVACAAGTAVMDVIVRDGLVMRAQETGKLFLDGFGRLQKKYPGLIREIRGKGLMLGIDMTRDAAPVVDAMRDSGILINGTNTTVLRFLPPLIIRPEHVTQCIEALDAVFMDIG